MKTETTIPVTLAEIARIAGVGRAAVSNWRRRHDTFPAPVAGTDASPLFALAEVEDWLSKSGKGNRVDDADRLWPRFEILGERDAAGTAIAVLGARLAGRDSDALAVRSLTPDEQALVDDIASHGSRPGGRTTFDALLTRWQDVNARQIRTTPIPLARLMAEIASLVINRAPSEVRSVLDPACGTGGLLDAMIQSRLPDPLGSPALPEASGLRIMGQDKDPVMAALTQARLMLLSNQQGSGVRTADVRAADSLLADSFADERADVVLCNPPFNAREWGHAALATDSRWEYGVPPRSEPELAWVQHALARLMPAGVGVLLVPAGVSFHKAGRRIRAALLKAGVLRAVVAMPAGSAPPYGIALQLWILRRPDPQNPPAPFTTITLVDAAFFVPDRGGDTAGGGKPAINWDELRRGVLEALQEGMATGDAVGVGTTPAGNGWLRVPVIELLDDQVDLTPAKYVPAAERTTGRGAAQMWPRFTLATTELRHLADELSRLESSPADGPEPPFTTVGDLLRAGALTIEGGRSLDDHAPRQEDATPGAVPVLTIPDLLSGGRPGGWLSAEALVGGNLTATRDGDVVVAAVARAFSVWVEEHGPTVLGPQLFLLRPDTRLLDPWFLAGCLRAPSNVRQAATHTSASSRVDVRQLRLPRKPLGEQVRYGKAARQIKAFEQTLREMEETGTSLLRDLHESLLAGRLGR